MARLQENAVSEVIEERPLSAADRAAGVVRDVLIRRLGTEKHNPRLKTPYRVVIVEPAGRTTRDGQALRLVLVTNRLDWSAELVALAYRYRWTVERFFRWLKCILGCRHRLHTSERGVTLQVYMAMIASLLISLWAERPPHEADLRDDLLLTERMGERGRVHQPTGDSTRQRPAKQILSRTVLHSVNLSRKKRLKARDLKNLR